MKEAIRIIGIDPASAAQAGASLKRWVIRCVSLLPGRFCPMRNLISPPGFASCMMGLPVSSTIRNRTSSAVEHTFVNKDATATLKLGQARGIALLVPALAGLKVAEYAPNAVKKAVIGVGHGEKKQIHMMVKVLMPKAMFDTDDAADAIAVAICHAHHRQSAIGRLLIEQKLAAMA